MLYLPDRICPARHPPDYGRVKAEIITAKLFNNWTFQNALKDGIVTRLHPVIMTAMMAAIGLMPAAVFYWYTGKRQNTLQLQEIWQ